MIKKKTVLILGAGASAHAGYPIGENLLRELCAIRIQENYPALPSSWTNEDVDNFLLPLSRSGHRSIDAFLEESNQLKLGKFLIASQLKKHENVDRLFPSTLSGWYQILLDSLINECGSEVGKNEISIITFNYDRSLEAYLHNVMIYRFGLSSEKAWQRVSEIPIVHVHGILGDYPDIPYETTESADDLLAISNRIKIIHEINDSDNGFCSDEFETANKMLRDSERIVFLGFGFHEDNIRRFQFFSSDTLSEREIFATTFGISPKAHEELSVSLKQYGFLDKRLPSGGNNCESLLLNILTL